MSERCHRCGGPFELELDAVVPVWRCRDCWREVPASALAPAPRGPRALVERVLELNRNRRRREAA
jgi:hypothetical protein